MNSKIWYIAAIFMTFAAGFGVVVGDGINFSSVVMFLEGLFFLRVAHGEIKIQKDKE